MVYEILHIVVESQIPLQTSLLSKEQGVCHDLQSHSSFPKLILVFPTPFSLTSPLCLTCIFVEDYKLVWSGLATLIPRAGADWTDPGDLEESTCHDIMSWFYYIVKHVLVLILINNNKPSIVHHPFKLWKYVQHKQLWLWNTCGNLTYLLSNSQI